MAGQQETITEIFDSEEAFRDLLTRINVPVRNIDRLLDEEGIDNARTLSTLRPDDVEKSLESVNRLFGNRQLSSCIYFAPARIKKIKSICAYLRRCMIVNRIPDIRLINQAEIQNFSDNLEEWSGSSLNIEGLIGKDDIKFEHTKFMRFGMKIQTIMSSIKGIRGITLDYLLQPDESQP